jgi:hypothetical protein
MAGLKTIYCRSFNVGVRLLGLWWSFVGVFAVFVGILWNVRGPASPEDSDVALFLPVVGALLLAAGVAFLRVRPYRPDLGDEPFSGASKGRSALKEPRKWWTGDPL